MCAPCAPFCVPRVPLCVPHTYPCVPTGFLSFYNARTKQLLHTFKARFAQPVLPAFMVRRAGGGGGCGIVGGGGLRGPDAQRCPCAPQVWCGSFHVSSGLQVPSAVKCLQKRNSAASSSTASLP